MDMCKIEGDDIVIRLRIESLPTAFAGGVDIGTIPEGWAVEDARKFAAELVRELEAEEEDGTTPIHKLFDAAMTAALENGAEGLVEVPEEKGDEEE